MIQVFNRTRLFKLRMLGKVEDFYYCLLRPPLRSSSQEICLSCFLIKFLEKYIFVYNKLQGCIHVLEIHTGVKCILKLHSFFDGLHSLICIYVSMFDEILEISYYKQLLRNILRNLIKSSDFFDPIALCAKSSHKVNFFSS